MLSIKVTVMGTQEEMSKLRKLGDSFLNLSTAMKAIGKALVKYYGTVPFASQGGAIGVNWPTLALSTRLYKVKHYPQYAYTPLIASGKMQDSFDFSSDNQSATIRNNAPYFKYHQSTAERRKLPRRPMFGINQDVKDMIHDAIQVDVHASIVRIT